MRTRISGLDTESPNYAQSLARMSAAMFTGSVRHGAQVLMPRCTQPAVVFILITQAIGQGRLSARQQIR